MSGFKRATVSIRQEEYDRLREAEEQLRTLPKVSGDTQERIANESNVVFQATIQELEQRQAMLREVLAGMNDYIRELEQNTSRAMIDFEANAIVNLEAYAGSLWFSFDQILASHSQQFEETITRNHRQTQHELGIMARRLRKMAGSQNKKKAIAEDWLAAAEQMAFFIRENYAWQFFLPEKHERLEQQLAQVYQNYNLGLSEAVIATSQQLYLAFSDLRVELERLEMEWQIMNMAVREALDRELSLLEQSRYVQAVDLDGNPLDYLVNVEYWTQGRLVELEGALGNLRAQYEDSQQPPDTETLSRWLVTDLSNCHQKLERIVLDARIAALNSQLRINIADLVVQALREQGFSLSNADYDASDMRLGYGMQLSNLEGSEVIVEVAPVGESIGDNELMISSLDKEQRTEHELVQRWDEISQSLSSYGLDVSRYTTNGSEIVTNAVAQPAQSVSKHPVQVKRPRSNRRTR